MLKDLEPFINVPKVLDVGHNKVVIEYIENNSTFDETIFAKELARLHLNSNQFFGLSYDTTIGTLFQPNSQNRSWIEFFVNERILYMAKESYKDRQINSTLLSKIELFCSKIESLIPKDITPSLIHGDIWRGNLISNNNKNYLIDPAIYYAHNEIELAFIMMFDTFSHNFFDSYSEIIKIDKEFFEYRYKIYQLYPYLVHLRIYGSSYIGGVKEIIDRFI